MVELRLRFLLIFLAILLLGSSVVAQVPAHPLIEDGILDAATCSGTAFNSGGSISVNGKTIKVPDNLIVMFPAAWVPFKDFVSHGYVGYEVSVAGNIINGVPIAAQIEVSQLLANFGDGIIESVNFADASLKIVGGPTIRINDPNAVFGGGYTSKPDFTADDENPSITAFSGFPMCIPRSATDSLCPASQRPAGKNTFQAPDALVMAPFLAGDYVEFNGIKIGGEIICYTIVATSVMITTVGTPSYVRIEDATIGVYDPAQVLVDEFGDTRFIGYTSDASVTLTISAIDVDPCTGIETDRIVGNAAPKAGDARNKFIWRADSTTLAHYTREYRIALSTGLMITKNGITAGQYVQPVTEWIYPEPLSPGILTPPIDFSAFNFLANGVQQDGGQYGQLNPWPGVTTPPAPSKCSISSTPTPIIGSSKIPIANAGVDQTAALPGSIITLTASNNNSNIPDTDVTYTWTQKDGPPISLTSSSTGTGASISFTAPTNSATTPKITRTFSVKITRKDDTSISSTDDILITTDKAVKDVVSIQSYTWTSQQGGTLSVTAKTNYVIDNVAAALKIRFNPAVALVGMVAAATGTGTGTGNGVWTYQARGVKNPSGGVSVLSAFGGVDTKVVTTAKKRRRGEGII